MMTNLLCKETVCSLSSKTSSLEPPCLETSSVKTKLIKDINRNYFNEDKFSCSPKRETIVRFCDESQNLVINEPEELIEYLAMARQGDFQNRQVDKERMERLLGPVLSKVHREKVYNERTELTEITDGRSGVKKMVNENQRQIKPVKRELFGKIM